MTCWIVDVQNVLALVRVLVIHLAILLVATAPLAPHVLPVVILALVDAVRLVLAHQNLHLALDVHLVVLVDVIRDVHLHVVELQNQVHVQDVVQDVPDHVVQDVVESVLKHVQVIASMVA